MEYAAHKYFLLWTLNSEVGVITSNSAFFEIIPCEQLNLGIDIDEMQLKGAKFNMVKVFLVINVHNDFTSVQGQAMTK